VPADGALPEAIEHHDESAIVAQEVAEAPLGRMLRRPHEPTPQEIEEHNKLHEPYRAWCASCVSGRGRVEYHRGRDHAQDAIPVLGVDYGFLSKKHLSGPDDDAENPEVDETGRPISPLLCGRCSSDRWLVGAMLPCKGVEHPFCVITLAKEIRATGHRRLFVRSDNEPAIRALIQQAGQEVRRVDDIDVVGDPTRQGDSDANGLAEGAVKEVKAKARTIKHATEQLLNVQISPDHPCLPFLILYACSTVNRGRKGADGRTSYELRFGRPWNGKIAEFAEKVMWLPLGKSASTLDSGYKEGIFLGLVERNNHYFIGLDGKVVLARAFKLLSNDRRRDPDLFNRIRGKPWCLDPAQALPLAGSAGEIAIRAHAGGVVEPAALPPPPAPEAERAVRAPTGLVIRRNVELAKYGYTEGCRGCMAASLGHTAVNHSPECRARIAEAMRADVDLRMPARLRGAEERVAQGAINRPISMRMGLFPGAAGDVVMQREDEPRGSRRAKRQAEVPAEEADADRRSVPEGSANNSSGSQGAVPDGIANNSSGSGGSATLLQAPGQVSMPPNVAASASGTVTPPANAPTGSSTDAPATGSAAPMDMGAFDWVDILERVNQQLLALTAVRVDVSEVFSPPRFTSKATAFNLVPGTAYDLRTGFNLSDPVVQRQVWKDLDEQKPLLVVGSPECAPFSSLQNFNDTSSPQYQEALKHGLEHLRFCTEVYRYQVSKGRLFLHEHPANAWSWQLEIIQHVSQLPGVDVVTGDQCLFGQKVQKQFARKRTRWMSNCPEICDALQGLCDGRKHEHIILHHGRAKQTERYPPKLVHAVLRALRKYMVRQGMLGSLEAGPTAEEPEFQVKFDTSDSQKYWDEYTGLELPVKETRKARADEIRYMNQLKVWKVELRKDACADGTPVYGVRWIDCNKGDDVNMLLRSRLVVQETNKVTTIAQGDVASTFAATPPIESLRFLLSLAMTLPKVNGEDWVVLFIDISRAHPHCDARRKVVIRLPEEAGYGPEYVGVMLKCLYGMKDAGQAFELKVCECMEAMGFVQGKFSPCHFYSRSKEARTWVHGDDFATLLPRSGVTEFVQELSKMLIVKVTAVLGPRQHSPKPDDRVVRILNRLVTWVIGERGELDEIHWEPDPRHVEILRRQCGLQENSKSVVSPGAKDCRQVLEGPECDEPTSRLFKSVCMRLAYLASDRPDICFTSKEAARAMAKPTVAAWNSLKRQVRFLSGSRRLVWVWRQQSPQSFVLINSDADYAGCLTTRRSTTCVVLRHGSHCIRVISSTQALVALSVGESEFYSLIKAAAMGIGFQSIAADWGLSYKIRIMTDSNSAKGTASRRGAGKLRHIDTPLLWIQQVITRRQVEICKTAGKTNVADLGTKILDGGTIRMLIGLLSLRYLSGQHSLGLRTA